MNTQALTPAAGAETAPSLPLLHAAQILAGLGTLLLGPILPILALRWHLADSQLGLLLMAQFIGATLGGSTTTHRLRVSFLIGLAAATTGFVAFAFAPGLVTACLSLLLAGFGVGRTIASNNIIAGARYTRNRATVLTWLNFSWSFGALLSPLSAAWLATRFPLPALLLAFAACFAGLFVTLLVQSRAALREPASTGAAPTHRISRNLFVYFASLLLLYGGLETSLAAWLTTYALRYGRSSLVLSEYTTVLFLCGLTAGRALAATFLKLLRESTLQRFALLLAAALTAALALAHSAGLIATAAVLLGIALAPIFPASFAIVLGTQPTPRQAGIILAASGIGAAALPWLMGLISTRTGSLQTALTLPILTALAMLTLTLLPPKTAQSKADTLSV